MIGNRNPDSLTYQFVLKAIPVLDGDGSSHGAMLASAQLRQLERVVADQKAEIRRLNSAIAWSESRPLVRAYRALQRALRMR